MHAAQIFFGGLFLAGSFSVGFPGFLAPIDGFAESVVRRLKTIKE